MASMGTSRENSLSFFQLEGSAGSPPVDYIVLHTHRHYSMTEIKPTKLIKEGEISVPVLSVLVGSPLCRKQDMADVADWGYIITVTRSFLAAI